MKLAISGKGGVGKSTIAGAIALILAKSGQKVLAVDADPDANLASALGFPHKLESTIIPISKQIELIEERTGAKVSQYGQMFKLNPEVADIADNYVTTHNGVSLLILGAVKKGGGGCACPESVLIRALVTDMILYKNQNLIMDMEAGVEHLGRATVKGVDTMLVVVEPGQRSIDCAKRIIKMASEIGLNKIKFVVNKVVSDEDKDFIEKALPSECDIVGYLPYSNKIRQADRTGMPVIDYLSKETYSALENIIQTIKGN